MGLVPETWPFARKQGGLFVACHRVMVDGPEQIPNLMRFDLLNCRLLLLWGSIPYMKTRSSTLKSWTYTLLQTSIEVELDARTEVGAHLVCIAPCPDGGAGHARRQVQGALGAAMMLFGENIAHSLVFEYEVLPDGRPRATVGDSFRLPNCYARTGLPESAGRLEALGLGRLSAERQHQVTHALAWLADGMLRSTSDALVAMWVGLEILAMPRGTTDVRPINERLAAQYKIPYRDACQQFGVGRLHGPRSRIVHGGQHLALSATVPLYLRAIFQDCLLNELGARSSAAATVLANIPVMTEIAALAQVR